MPLGTEVDLSPVDIMLDGDPTPPQRGGGTAPLTPSFGPSVVAKPLRGSRCHLVRGLASAQAILCYMGTQLTPKKGHSSPQFSAHVCCGKTAEWIKIPFGAEVGLGPGHIVLDVDPAPPKGAQKPPLFGPPLL